MEGCAPCLLPSGSPQDAAAFAAHAPSLADPGFVQSFLQPAAETTEGLDSVDEETAAVAQAARAHQVPFLGVRAVSDGGGDPLHLPGFPWQFFVYRQLAGNNAATVTLAFLQVWKSLGSPTAHSGSTGHRPRHRARAHQARKRAPGPSRRSGRRGTRGTHRGSSGGPRR
jgi:hypothetical protein